MDESVGYEESVAEEEGCMRKILLIFCLGLLLWSCSSSYRSPKWQLTQDEKIWAFGEENLYEPLHMMDDIWNERHSDIFILQGTDYFDQSIFRIKKAYKEKKEV